MARTPEGAVKAAVKKILDEMGIYHFSPVQNGMGRAGIPDIIGSFYRDWETDRKSVV